MSHPANTALGFALRVDSDHLAFAAEVERLGYSTLWVPGGQLDTLDRLTELLRATEQVTVAPAIISPDAHSADAVAELFADAEATAPGRLQLGLSNGQHARPLAAFARYLDRLDDLGVPPDRRVIAALGPRKLDLARDRAGAAITLLVTPTHTAQARSALGVGRRLVVDQFVVLDDDPQRARETARGPLRFLSQVGGYRANLARMGFSVHDVDTLSDRLVDAVVAWGDAATIRDRLRAHLDAGADEVVIAPLPVRGGHPLSEIAQVFAPHTPVTRRSTATTMSRVDVTGAAW